MFDKGGEYVYIFERNPDRHGGDTGWKYILRYSQFNPIGGSFPNIHSDGFNGAIRTLRFTAVSGIMKRKLEAFYRRRAVINGCRDHLHGTFDETETRVTDMFSVFITDFSASPHPVNANSFPYTGEDTWDIEMTMMRVS
jgi:hypothetical protein